MQLNKVVSGWGGATPSSPKRKGSSWRGAARLHSASVVHRTLGLGCVTRACLSPQQYRLYVNARVHPAQEPDYGYCYYYYYRYSLTVGPSSSRRSTHVHSNQPHHTFILIHAFILILLRSKHPGRPSWKCGKENPHTTSASLFLSLWFPVFLIFSVCLFPSKWKKTRKKVQDQGESLSPQPATSLPTLWRDR